MYDSEILTEVAKMGASAFKQAVASGASARFQGHSKFSQDLYEQAHEQETMMAKGIKRKAGAQETEEVPETQDAPETHDVPPPFKIYNKLKRHRVEEENPEETYLGSESD